VAVCVYHLFVCVLDALVSERSVCELSDRYDTVSLDICFIVLRRKVLPSLPWVQGLFETLDVTEHITANCQEQHTQLR
jgi:hypothetical protein